MFSINNNNITLTRGDSFIADLTIYNPEGTEFTPEEGDIITFAVKRTAFSYKPIIEKTIDISEMKVELFPSETRWLGFNTYLYDINIQRDAHIDTFIRGTLKITEEVHSRG